MRLHMDRLYAVANTVMRLGFPMQLNQQMGLPWLLGDGQEIDHWFSSSSSACSSHNPTVDSSSASKTTASADSPSRLQTKHPHSSPSGTGVTVGSFISFI